MIVNKLKIGVSIDRILDEVRKVERNKLSRFNLASRKDINYLTKKHNIDKRRHENDVVAVGLKVQEDESSILDQVAQEPFLGALKKEVEEELQPEYVMTNDDPKHYNARRILNTERPNANSYQGKVTLIGHKTAERMDRNLITEVRFGEFQEKEGSSVSGDIVETFGDQSREIKNFHHEEIQNFIKSKRAIDEGTNKVDRETIRRMGNQEILNALNELDIETYLKKLKAI
ncbi:hypothetical protein ILUMI_10294 [Ignelater luminosus]|uniref:Uncharacterized protein n=1 Tax=Ignelater luminosus TaxID=2038154 RepID=A0A8K0CY72_IGNLU|nr:hypothetical protein ILUMI_10294 [Ignelater luminosus]